MAFDIRQDRDGADIGDRQALADGAIGGQRLSQVAPFAKCPFSQSEAEPGKHTSREHASQGQGSLHHQPDADRDHRDPQKLAQGALDRPEGDLHAPRRIALLDLRGAGCAPAVRKRVCHRQSADAFAVLFRDAQDRTGLAPRIARSATGIARDGVGHERDDDQQHQRTEGHHPQNGVDKKGRQEEQRREHDIKP